MNALSICTGAGGFDYAAQWLLGWRVKAYVDIDEHAQRCIAQRIDDGIFHRGHIYGDLRSFVSEGYAESYRGVAQMVFGGPPCQPFSSAGKMLGEDDPRDLSEVVLEALRIVEPEFFFMENSTDAKGLTHAAHWGRFLHGLAALGYDVGWDCLRACDVGAPHRRDRLWLLARLPEWKAGADAGGERRREGERERLRPQGEQPGGRSLGTDAPDSGGPRRQRSIREGSGGELQEIVPGQGGEQRSAADADEARRLELGRSEPGADAAGSGVPGVEGTASDPDGDPFRDERQAARPDPDAHRRRQQELPQRDREPLAGGQASLWGDALRSATGHPDGDRLELGTDASGGRQEPAEGAGPWSVESFPSPVAHGVADRRLKLRASGEGVVPLVVATALLRLAAGMVSKRKRRSS